MVATIVSALLYFNIFNLLFMEQGDDCGSYVRPQLDRYGGTHGWIWHTLSADEGSYVHCSAAFFNGIQDSVLFSFVGLAICGLVMRRAIKREDAR